MEYEYCKDKRNLLKGVKYGMSVLQRQKKFSQRRDKYGIKELQAIG